MKTGLTMSRRWKAALIGIPALAVALPLALPATSASAATNYCNHFKSGGVSFAVCVEHVSGDKVQAQIGQIAGTYVSGHLGLDRDGTQVKSFCSGQYPAGSSCSFTYSGSSGTYESIWHSKSSGSFDSPSISA